MRNHEFPYSSPRQMFTPLTSPVRRPTNKDVNKQRFDALSAHKPAIEATVGEPLKWEKLDNKRACRIAGYTRAQILMDSDSPARLDWAVKKAVDFHRAFAPEFPNK
jgi:hypothetical protein